MTRPRSRRSHRSLARKVLEHKREQRRDRVGTLVFVAVYISLLTSVMCVGIRDSLREIRKSKPAVAALTSAPVPVPASAPTPSDGFVLKETVIAVDDDGLPHRLLINGEEWQLELIDHFPDAIGHLDGETFYATQAKTRCAERRIMYIRTENRNTLRANLLHEIFHAGDCLHGGDTWWNSEHPTVDYHPGVYHLGDFTAAFLHDNPLFLEWMRKP